ncbi:MAG: protein translocase subunit SecY [Pseudomonadota bacterium]
MNWLSTIWRMPDLRSRILFTLGMLAVFRLGVHVPAPGVDREGLAAFLTGGGGTMFGLYNMFSGGALQQFSVLVLGIMPYITASIIIQILTVVFPPLERLSKEGQQGRGKITQYTRYATLGIALVQSFTLAVGFERMTTPVGTPVVLDPGLRFQLLTMATLTAGSCFVMWLGEQITERGVGNGSSLIITAGIVAGLPQAVVVLFEQVKNGDMDLLAVTLIGIGAIVVIGLIVWMERAQRRIPIQYAKRVVGRRVYGGQTTHLPLKINTTGVIPPIFASTVLMLPATLKTLLPTNPAVDAVTTALTPGHWLYDYAFVGLIVFIAYFYTALMFNPVDVADNLKKNGGYVPGVRPGKQTAEYLDQILTRLTGAGALYLAVLCILPTVLITQYNLPFYFGGTGLLIVVGVSLDTVAQIESQLLTRHYDGLSGPNGGPRAGRRSMAPSGMPG